jgi:hypothetical protein
MNTATNTLRKAKRIYPVFIAATVFVLFCGFVEFLAFWLLIPSIFGMFCQLIYAGFRRADSQRIRFLCAGICIWISAFALVFWIHDSRSKHVRAQADVVARKIKDFQARHGACPQTPETIGETWESLEARLRRPSAYRCEKGSPSLLYVVPASAFEIYRYSFEDEKWYFVLH